MAARVLSNSMLIDFGAFVLCHNLYVTTSAHVRTIKTHNMLLSYVTTSAHVRTIKTHNTLLMNELAVVVLKLVRHLI